MKAAMFLATLVLLAAWPGVLGDSPAPAAPFAAPGAPRGFVASPGPGLGQVRLAWSPPSDDGGAPVTNYRLYRGSASGAAAFLVELGPTTVFVDASPAPLYAQYYQVTAVNAVGEGLRSAEVCTAANPWGTPLKPALGPPCPMPAGWVEFVHQEARKLHGGDDLIVPRTDREVLRLSGARSEDGDYYVLNLTLEEQKVRTSVNEVTLPGRTTGSPLYTFGLLRVLDELSGTPVWKPLAPALAELDPFEVDLLHLPGESVPVPQSDLAVTLHYRYDPRQVRAVACPEGLCLGLPLDVTLLPPPTWVAEKGPSALLTIEVSLTNDDDLVVRQWVNVPLAGHFLGWGEATFGLDPV